MAKMYHITKEVDELARCKIASNARGIKWRCDELARLAMYPDSILNQIRYGIEKIKQDFKALQSEIGEPEDVYFDKDMRKP